MGRSKKAEDRLLRARKQAPLERRATMQDVADAAGLSKVTVSRCLRGDPRFSEATRARVRETARKLGYRPDALVAALMSRIRGGGRRGVETIAIVGYETEAMKDPAHLHHWFYEGARRRVLGLGHRVESFFPRVREVPFKRMAEILRARGIQGMILLPWPFGEVQAEPACFENLATVALGHSFPGPPLDGAATWHFQHAKLAYERLSALGFRRIGFADSRHSQERTLGQWLGGFLATRPLLGGGEAVPELLFTEFSPEAVRKWILDHEVDAVIATSADLLSSIASLPAKRRPFGVTLQKVRTPEEISGVDQQMEVVGAKAAEMVADKLQRGDLGLPEVRCIQFVPGRWVAGTEERERFGAKVG